ncbi:MAG: protein kinase [Kouleothrix sp.]|nr:protein kinase [Kouleothrix sp.]
MATVYKAYQPALDRYVAIKMLACPHDPQFVSRFRREARAIARLQHPNIVPIYDYGEQDDMLYVVLQYIEGAATLADLLEEPIDLAAALRLVYRLLDALSYAHRRGVVHRDIKPTNVLMPTPRWPMLADFGIAKLAHESQRLTLAGQTVGTPVYMAPEQAVGGPIDARADLYAVGVVLYEMLTGQVPFEGDAPTVVVAKHLYEAPVPPRQLNPDLPQVVEAIVLRALAKNPAARYQSAQEMARDLERAAVQLQRQPVSLPSRSQSRALELERSDQAAELLGQLVALDPRNADGLRLRAAARDAQDRVVRREPARAAEVAPRVAGPADPGVVGALAPAVRGPAEDDAAPAPAGRVELWLAGGSAALMALLLFAILSSASLWGSGSLAAANLPTVARPQPTATRPPTATPQLLGIAGDPAARVLVATMTERPSPSPSPTVVPPSPTLPPTQQPVVEQPVVEQPVVEQPTDAPTEAPTEVPTEALPTEVVPTEAPTDAPTEAPTDAPTEAPTDAPTEAPTDAPTEALPIEAAPTEPAQATWPLSLVLGMTSTH